MNKSVAPALSRLLRFRYSLRTFLIVATLISAWLAWAAHRARTQRSALEAIQSADGAVSFDYHESGPRTWSYPGRPPRGPQWLRNLLGPQYFDRVTFVSLPGTAVDEKWLKAVNDLPSVKWLRLWGHSGTDASLARLRKSTALLGLQLTSSKISDAGLEHLAKFPNLRWLTLNNTRVTDSGMAHLSQLGSLEELILTNTKVSDASIPAIAGLRKLQLIDLRGTQVTERGAQRIREQAPNLKVLR